MKLQIKTCFCINQCAFLMFPGRVVQGVVSFYFFRKTFAEKFKGYFSALMPTEQGKRKNEKKWKQKPDYAGRRNRSKVPTSYQFLILHVKVYSMISLQLSQLYLQGYGEWRSIDIMQCSI